MDRDLTPQIKTHAGFSGCDYPSEIKWKGDRQSITRIIKQWREPGSKHYLVETANGAQFKLVFVETSTEWLVTEITITLKE